MDRAKRDERPTWQLILEGARHYASSGHNEFTRLELVSWVQSIDPSRLRPSIDPIIQGMTDNATGGPVSACGVVFHRVDRGRYRLIGTTVVGGTSTTTEGPASLAARRPRAASARRQRVEARMAGLIADFDACVAQYDASVPFLRSGQYELHRATIDRRARHTSVEEALADDQFLTLLYSTLQAWGIGKRASRLAPLVDFVGALRRETSALEEIAAYQLESLARATDEVGHQVWALIARLPVVDNIARIVAGTKTLHHLVPALVPPMDRAWTGRFFEWNAADLQSNQQATFTAAWADVVAIAAATRPSRLVGDGWHTSQSKIVDNAVMAYSMR